MFILYRADCEKPYLEIDIANQSIMDLENVCSILLEQAYLFEVPPPEANRFVSLTKLLRLNKQLWDFVYVVTSWIEVWKSTLWKTIDSESIDMELKRFAKELKSMV